MTALVGSDGAFGFTSVRPGEYVIRAGRGWRVVPNNVQLDFGVNRIQLTVKRASGAARHPRRRQRPRLVIVHPGPRLRIQLPDLGR